MLQGIARDYLDSLWEWMLSSVATTAQPHDLQGLGVVRVVALDVTIRPTSRTPQGLLEFPFEQGQSDSTSSGVCGMVAHINQYSTKRPTCQAKIAART